MIGAPGHRNGGQQHLAGRKSASEGQVTVMSSDPSESQPLINSEGCVREKSRRALATALMSP